ncbi:MAG: PQQ-binding-like beta-propeller repeat protein [Verrucomicrobiota bacterium]
MPCLLSRRSSTTGLFLMAAALGLLAFWSTARADFWSGFRGQGLSQTDLENLPLTWSEEEGIAWRVPLAGFGQSSPVVWGDRVFVTSTGGEQKEDLFVEAFAVSTGERLWQKRFPSSAPVKKVSRMISQGAPTPVVDGEALYVFFESGDLFSLTHGGDLRWSRQLTEEFGEFEGRHGVGSSLVKVPGALVLLLEHDGPSYLLSMDRATGQDLWKQDREPRISWSTPLYLESKGQLVISSNGILEGRRVRDGRQVWWMEGIKGNTVASPSSDGSLVVIGSSSPKQSLAIRLEAEEEEAGYAFAWRAESVTSSFASPLINRETVYYINRAGTLQAQRLADGTQRWEHRLPDSCWASPLAAGERLYFFCKDGTGVVMDADPAQPTVLQVNTLPLEDKVIVYGFAVAPERFLVRTGRELFGIGPAL